MTYSPDFSSVSPASNWVAPPSLAPSTDYAYAPDAYADASRTPEAVYVPTAPLMQAPAQDVYSPPVPQPIAGNVSSVNTYTPSFAKSSAPEEADVDDEEANKPIPFMGKHPTQTVLASGAGALGGALIGGSVKHLFFSGDKEDAAPAAAGKTTETKTAAKTAAGWEFSGVHPDGKTPKKVTNTVTKQTYNIDANGIVSGFNLDGSAITSAGNSGFTHTAKGLEKNIEHEWLGIKTGTTNETYKKHTAEIIELISHKTGGILSGVPLVGSKMPHLPKYERYLYNKSSNVVVVLNKNGDIKKLITGVGGVAKSIGNKPQKTDLETALNAFGAALGTNAKTNFVNWLTDRKLFGKIPLPLDPVTRHNNYSQNPQDKWLVKLSGFDFDGALASTSSNGYYPDFNALNAQCQFVPESVNKAKEAAEKAAKEIKWGELVLPALAGAGIVGVGVFVVDFILQRRKSNATTAEPEGA